MYNTKVKVLSKGRCLMIANIVGIKGESDDEKLLYLPNKVFGRVHRVDYMAGDFVVYDNADNELHWNIPPYFIEEVYNIN